MTRGKHGQASAVRREASQQAAEVAVYQKRVADLTAENKEFKAKQEETRRSHAAEVKRLKAQVIEAVSPALAVVEREAKTLRDERDAALATVKQMQRRWEVALSAAQRHAMGAHGLKPLLDADDGSGRGVRINRETEAWLDENFGLKEATAATTGRVPSSHNLRKTVNRNQGVSS